jgi:hypothetical protein
MSSNCQHCTPERLTYEQLTENVKIHRLGQLMSAITCATEQQDSQEYTQLQEDTDGLNDLKEFMHIILPNETLASSLHSCNGNDILSFIQQHQEELKKISASLFIPALKAIMEGKDQEFPEQPSSFAEHPIAFYAQLLNDFVEIKFFALSEEDGSTITRTFNFCCQKLYNASATLEEQVTKKEINTVVDCMWLFTLLEKHKNEVIYVLGGWRYANMMVMLEELRQKYADQSLENLEDKQMIKLMEALAASASMEEGCGCDDENSSDDCCCGCK